jgi:hypothetical protein
MGQSLGNLLGNVFDIENGAFIDGFGQRRFPLDARQQLDVAHRRDERSLVLRWKGPVDPIEEAGKRDAHVLPRIADDDPGGRPGDRNQPRGDRLPGRLGAKTVNDRERAAVAAQHEDPGFVPEV